MLDPWIIEEILKKEEERRREEERGRAELPVERHRDDDRPSVTRKREETERAVRAGRLVALARTVDAAVRLAIARRRGRPDPDGAWAELGYVVYFGGMSGGLIVLCGWLFGADELVGRHASVVVVTWRVVAIASVLLVLHYAIQGAR